MHVLSLEVGHTEVDRTLLNGRLMVPRNLCQIHSINSKTIKQAEPEPC